MTLLTGRLALALLTTQFLTTQLLAQTPAIPTPARRQGGFVPGQKRADEDPAQVARGKSLYGLSCRACHGADLRGGDIGGPNLLRSQLALSDREGEKIVPVIEGSLQAGGMPAIPMSGADAKAVAAYVRSVMATIGGQGMPPSALQPPTILVGNATAGKAYFEKQCASCHSVTGDLQGLAARIPDPKTLQNTWVAGRGRAAGPNRKVTVTVTAPGEAPVSGRLLRLDDFLVALELPDETSRSFRRNGDVPKVEVNDPLAPHRALFSVYSDEDIHNVTAYLVTLK
ncbi:MAG: c-type cytochrome [Bryobacteraceae bacterium]|nr:c-type cytochrome [Bryobacteraceae bacterium]